MTELKKNLIEAYDNLDNLRELLEFENTNGIKENHLKLLDDARDALNRYLSAVEKFDRIPVLIYGETLV
jgi:hypothetical protein